MIIVRVMRPRDPAWYKGHRVLFGVLTAAGMLVVNATIAPSVRSWKHAGDVDRYLRSDSLLTGLIADSPESRAPIRAGLLRAMETGNSAAGVTAVREAVASALPRYLRTAPDDAIVDYTRAMVAQLRDHAGRDPEDCYRLLFPKVAGPPKPSADAEAMLQSMRHVMLRARQTPMPTPAESEI